MRIAGALVVTVLLVIGSSASPAAQNTAKGSQNAAIHAVADAYVQASLKGDAKAIAALYTDDAVEMPPNAPMIKGRAAIEQYYQKQFGSGTKVATFSLTHLESQALGDNAYDVGTYSQNITPPGAKPGTDTGKYTVILKRSGGAWKVAYAIYNSDLPPQPQK
jgi:uncharacterized protein (TIGR02246 family)